jgi:hypothetical protein
MDVAKKLALYTQLDNDWKAYRRLRNVANTFISKSKKRNFLPNVKDKVFSQSLWYTVNELTSLQKKISVPIFVLEHKNTIIGDKCRINDLLADEFLVYLILYPITPHFPKRLIYTLRILFMMKTMSI